MRYKDFKTHTDKSHKNAGLVPGAHEGNKGNKFLDDARQADALVDISRHTLKNLCLWKLTGDPLKDIEFVHQFMLGLQVFEWPNCKRDRDLLLCLVCADLYSQSFRTWNVFCKSSSTSFA